MNREWMFLAFLALILGAVIVTGKINANRALVDPIPPPFLIRK